MKEGEVPTGRFGFSFHHFVKWKRSCMQKSSCKTRRNTIPNCPMFFLWKKMMTMGMVIRKSRVSGLKLANPIARSLGTEKLQFP